MPRDIVDDFLDALKRSFLETTQEFTERTIRENMPHAPRQRRVSGAAKQKPKPKVKRETHGPTLYDDLEVSPHASAETIRAAYLSLSKRYHPDVTKHKGAAERMKQINAAWTVLQDEKKRAAYNRQIGLRQ